MAENVPSRHPNPLVERTEEQRPRGSAKMNQGIPLPKQKMMAPSPRLRALLLGLLLASPACLAQASASPAAQAPATPTRLLGTVTATSADTLTLKLETGAEVIVQLSPQTKMVRTAPGEKTLAGATAIQVTDLATGDRVLVRAAPGADATHFSATAVIAMKQADIAQAHAGQSEDWQRHGVSGVVKSVQPDAASGSGSGGPAILISGSQPGSTLAIRVTTTTIFRRYAPDSVNFADAKSSSLAEIHAGDQLRARGERGADGITAAEIISGSFRNLAGTITSVDPANNSLTLTDLTTKKPVTLRLTGATQMRRLPAMMAQMLATHGAGRPGAGPYGSAAGSRAPSPAVHGAQPGGADQTSTSAGAAAGATPGQGRPDPAMVLQRAPAITLADLKKGDALMIVSSADAGSTPSTAITIIAGVEPLLESSAGTAGQDLLSASWNLNGGGSAEAGPQ